MKRLKLRLAWGMLELAWGMLELAVPTKEKKWEKGRGVPLQPMGGNLVHVLFKY